MKTLYSLLVLTLLFGCVSEEKCIRKFPPVTSIEIKEIIRDSIIYKDTTIYISLPPDTIYSKDTIYIKEGKIYVRPVEAESKMAKARSWIDNNILNLMLTDKDTTLEVRLENAQKEAYYWRERYENKKEVVVKKYVPHWVQLLASIGAFAILLLILVMLNRLKIIKIF